MPTSSITSRWTVSSDGLTDFGKTGQQGDILVFPAGILRDQQFVAMADGDDDGRTDARINHGMAVAAVYHAFVLAVHHGAAAMATIDVVAVPVVQGQAGDAGKGR